MVFTQNDQDETVRQYIEERIKIVDQKSANYGRSAVPRPSDVFIATAAKAGTTWMTQICHMLRSAGDTDFEDISMECPWNIFAQAVGQDIHADHKYEPRVFKTHDSFEQINKNPSNFPGCKYIVVCREPIKSRISAYHFVPGYSDTLPILQGTKIDWESDMSKNDGLGLYNWPEIYLSWYKATLKYRENILWVFYEDLVADAEREIHRVLDFMEIVPDENQGKKDELVAIALEKSSKDFMLENTRKFDGHFILVTRMKQIEGPEYILPFDGVKTVQKRKKADTQKLVAQLEEYVAEMWKSKMKLTGCGNYEEFKQKIRQVTR